MSDQYYRWFPGDYMRDTGTLTLLEHGAYRTLLDHYYCEEILPNDLPRLYHLCRATTERDRKAIKYVVDKFFEIDDLRLKNPRADHEIALRNEYTLKQSLKGKRSAASKALNRGSTTVEPSLNLPSPSPVPSLDLIDQDQKKTVVPRPKSNGRFTVPSVSEISEYCRERKNQVDPTAFHAFYTSNGWRVGKNPMKKWKAAVVTWERR